MEDPKAGQQAETSEAERRRAAWNDRLVGAALVCLVALIVTEALSLSIFWLRAVLMIGLAVAGTGVWILQARRACPKCGTPCGYQLRLLKANLCRRCGAEFPQWSAE